MKLNQIVAIVNGKKTETKNALTELYRQLSRKELFSGLTRTYQPLDEEGETFPPESKIIECTVADIEGKLQEVMVDFLDTVATQDIGNVNALTDVEVDGEVIFSQIPVTYLLFLEKQLIDIETFFSALPVLDSGEPWRVDDNTGMYVSDVVQTNKTKKTVQHKVLYEATKEHPAQIHTWNEDVKVGVWNTQKFSGAVSQTYKDKIVKRVKELQQAVKFAREEANSIEVKKVEVGKQLFAYLLK